MNNKSPFRVIKGKLFWKSWKIDLENTVQKGSSMGINIYDEIKSRISMQDLAENLLGRGKPGNGYITYKCPFHQEQKGRSLIVYPHHWECYGACGTKGDQFALVEKHFNVNHQAAKQWLVETYMNGVSPRGYEKHEPIERKQSQSEPPPSDWQQKAIAIKNRAVDTLHSKDGQRALDYLINRGLAFGTILHAELGYIPGHYTQWQKIEGLNVPCGITIPWMANDAIWGIKVRRAAGDKRYEQIAGGNIKGCLYRADEIQPGTPLVFSEGEFDSLIVWQTSSYFVSSTCLGSSSNTSINIRWFPTLAASICLLSAMDDDEAGQKANQELMKLSSSFYPITYPHGMDANEYFLSFEDHYPDRPDLFRVHGMQAFSHWLELQINQLKQVA